MVKKNLGKIKLSPIQFGSRADDHQEGEGSKLGDIVYWVSLEAFKKNSMVGDVGLAVVRQWV